MRARPTNYAILTLPPATSARTCTRVPPVDALLALAGRRGTSCAAPADAGDRLSATNGRVQLNLRLHLPPTMRSKPCRATSATIRARRRTSSGRSSLPMRGKLSRRRRRIPPRTARERNRIRRCVRPRHDDPTTNRRVRPEERNPPRRCPRPTRTRARARSRSRSSCSPACTAADRGRLSGLSRRRYQGRNGPPPTV